MAIYHLSAQIIGRSGGKSAVASAAYRAGEKLHDEHIGQTFDYTKKRGVDYTEILVPSNAPEWASDRSRLWNEVERIEKSKNSQLARELNIALPKELTREQQIELIRNFAKQQFVAKGMIADVALHNLAGENPHAHIMLTIRPFNEDKTWGAKSKKEYILDRDGEKITLKSGEYKSRKIESTDWNKKETLVDWRKEWSEQTNQALEKAGVLEHVDHRSLKDQGERNRLPQKHIGVHANAMEKRGIKTERGDYNRAILEINADIKQYREDNAVCKKEEKQYQTKVEEQTSTPSIIVQQLRHDIKDIKPERTAEQTAERLQELKAQYISLEQQIISYSQQNSQFRYEQRQLSGELEQMNEFSSSIEFTKLRIDQLKEQRGSLGLFKGKEKRRLDEQMKSLGYSKQQATNSFKRNFGVEPSQAQEQVQRLKEQSKAIQLQRKSLPDSSKLREQQQTIEYQYKREKALSSIRPDKEKIESLLSINQTSQGKETIEDRTFRVRAESRLNHISQDDYKKIIKEVDPVQSKAMAMAMAEQKTNTPKFSHSQDMER